MLKYRLKIANLTTLALLFIGIPFENFASSYEPEYMFITETNIIETLVVRRSRIEIDVPDAGVTFEVGDRLPLFQTDSDGYIAGMERLNGNIELIAFPKRGTKNQPTGWVTNDKFLIFARNAKSIKGMLKLDRYEVLDVLNSHSDHLEVILRRNGRETILRIPSKSSGFKRSEREVTFRRKIQITPEDKNQLASKKPNRTAKNGRKISVRYENEAGMVIENAQGEQISEQSSSTTSVDSSANSANIVFVNPGTPLKNEQAALQPAPSSYQQTMIRPTETQTREQVVAELKEVVMLEIMAELRKSKDILAAETDSNLEEKQIAESLPEPLRVESEEATGPVLKKADILAIVETEALPETFDEEVAEESASNTEEILALVEETIEAPLRVATQALEVATATGVESVVESIPVAVEPIPEIQTRRADSRPDAVGPILGFFISNTMMFQILLMVCVVEGVMLVRLQKQKLRSMVKTSEATSASEFFSIESSGESFISESYNESKDAEQGDLNGTLDGYGLGQVIQFFHSSGDSGVLTIINLQGDKETMIFKDGRIIQAQSGKLTKDEAVYQIMLRSEGSFDFKREDTTEVEVQIVQDTMSLLLEGSRLADEKGFDNGM